jgi:hypothetical protein
MRNQSSRIARGMVHEEHLLFVWTPAGYRLEEREGEPPAVGAEVELNGEQRQRVTKIGPSPLPGDDRPCAYLQA